MKPKPLDLYDSDFSEKLIKELARIQDEGADNIAERVIELIKQHIKSACEFFLRYKGNPSLLIMERPELKEEVENMFLDRYSTAKYGVNVWRLEQYNEWLFKLAFKDVFEGEQR